VARDGHGGARRKENCPHRCQRLKALLCTHEELRSCRMASNRVVNHAFAFNLPAVFVETNIRTVFIHSFLEQEKVADEKSDAC